MPIDYKGKVAIVTGAGAGLGRCYAMVLAERGAKVVVNDLGAPLKGGDVDESRGRPADIVVDEIKAMGGEAVADYNNVMEGEKVVKTAIDTWGRIDIIVNNAGILRDVSFKKMQPKDWQMVLDVHIGGHYSISRAAWPYMLEQKYGRCVFVTSINGLYGQVGQTNYATAKSGIVGFAKALAKEGAKSNIKVNVVAPGAGSRMTATIMPEDLVDKWKPDYVAPCVAYLCAEDVPTTGCVFEAGGGWMAQVKYQRSPGFFFDIEAGYDVDTIASAFHKVCDFTEPVDPEEIATRPGYLTEQIQQIVGMAKPSKL